MVEEPSVMNFSLWNPAFRPRELIPARHTADRKDRPPPPERTDPPPGVRRYVLIMEDPDAPSGLFHHWGLYNIADGRDRLPEGVGHSAPTEDLGMAANHSGHPRYDGPVPPAGDKPHRYVFRLGALDVEALSQAPKLTVAEVWGAAQNHLIAETTLNGIYRR
jgi:Raf kinase inhibitor-like YbhB/YbcL family protein